MAKPVREIMTSNPECIGEEESLVVAAQKLKRLNVGALPICGNDNRLKGMLTDRDIVVKVIAEGRAPERCKAGELAQGKPVMIRAEDSVGAALRLMKEHQVRRLPVIEQDTLVGIISQADLATNIDDTQVGELVESISAAP